MQRFESNKFQAICGVVLGYICKEMSDILLKCLFLGVCDIFGTAVRQNKTSHHEKL